MKSQWPQIIILTMTAIGLLLNANMHGKKKEDNYNFWISAIATLISISLLYWGGFFDKLF